MSAREASTFPPIAELVPHEPPMLLVDELCEWSEERARVRATVRAGGVFVAEGAMPATILLEYMAQAIAAASGMRQRVHDLPAGLGLLLGTRELRLELAEIALGTELDIEVIREFDDGKLARYACSVRAGGQPLASATINVMATSAEEIRT